MYAVKDANLTVTKALPNGAAGVTTDGVPTGNSATGASLARCECLIEAPALTTGELANGATVKFDVEHSDDDVTYTALAKEVLVQTGAGGAGAAAAQGRLKLPTNVKAYVRAKATNSGAGNLSGKTLTFGLVF